MHFSRFLTGGLMVDVIIIGAGIVGCALAYTLSLTNLRVLVLEKNVEVLDEVSSANSGIIHAGYDPDEGSLKARLNVRGSQLYREWCPRLGVERLDCGGLVIAKAFDEMEALEALKVKAERRGIPFEVLNREAALAIEPHLTPEVIQALHFPTVSVILPWQMGYAMITNAVANGVTLKTNEPVMGVTSGKHFTVQTPHGTYAAKMVVNCAGLGGDTVAQLHDPSTPKRLYFRKGEYQITDKFDGDYLYHVIYPVPSPIFGKGVLAIKTVEGNLMFGPNSQRIEDPTDNACTSEGLEEVQRKLPQIIVPMPLTRMIRQFAGVRPISITKDFILEEKNGWVNAIGIDSPGLASAPAIAEYLLNEFIAPRLHPLSVDRPVTIVPQAVSHLPPALRHQKIQSNPDYGRIVCVCEGVSKQDVIDAIHGPVPATTLKGIKRRLRPGSGRCQGGFCESRIVEILAQELNVDPAEVLYDTLGTQFLSPIGAHHE
jgi:glycerol-3-phosphate dehydrogenase